MLTRNAGGDDEIAVELVQCLIYKGRAELARFFVEQRFEDPRNREEFWNAVIGDVQRGTYWKQLLQMNRENLGPACPI